MGTSTLDFNGGVVDPSTSQLTISTQTAGADPLVEGDWWNDTAVIRKHRDVIIISFVRSPVPCTKCVGKGCPTCKGKGFLAPGLSFVRDLRRLNVAFSRARKMLILVCDIDVIANPKLRGGSEGAQVLKHFVEHVQNKGKVLHVWQTEDHFHES